jgi:hypothetical protein
MLWQHVGDRQAGTTDLEDHNDSSFKIYILDGYLHFRRMYCSYLQGINIDDGGTVFFQNASTQLPAHKSML